MTEIRFEHPLKLPEGWVSTSLSEKSSRNNFSYHMSLTEALEYLYEELSDMKLTKANIYTNYQNITNERTRKQISQNSGVSVEMQFESFVSHLACDLWVKAEHNIYAIYLAIRNLKQFEGWGIASGEYMFSIFSNRDYMSSIGAANSDSGMPEWMEYMGLGPTATIDDANAVYRRRVKKIADDDEKLLALNNAMDKARKYLK